MYCRNAPLFKLLRLKFNVIDQRLVEKKLLIPPIVRRLEGKEAFGGWRENKHLKKIYSNSMFRGLRKIGASKQKSVYYLLFWLILLFIDRRSEGKGTSEQEEKTVYYWRLVRCWEWGTRSLRVYSRNCSPQNICIYFWGMKHWSIDHRFWIMVSRVYPIRLEIISDWAKLN